MSYDGKLCLDCRHFEFSWPTPCYSELTPGDAGEITCYKGHFRLSECDDKPTTGPLLKSVFMRAESCADYEEVEG